MDEFRINRIIESALSLHRTLEDMKRFDLARKASDIYATAKEIKEGAAEIECAENGKSESFWDLPEWAAVNKWIYNIKKHEYFKILHLNQLAWISDEIKNGDYIEARQRPFNAEEMEALVGKVYESACCTFLVAGYDMRKKSIKVNELWFDSEELMNGKKSVKPLLINGKPCYVLEHLENGEWVE